MDDTQAPLELQPYGHWPDPIVELSHQDMGATIRYVGDGFELHWTDYVANDWTECYPRLDVAIMRLGLLMSCARTDWWAGFRDEPAVFYRNADEFVALCETFAAQNTSDLRDHIDKKE